jgi:2-polyprenyl-3-methyl-5-hydroxy-6-metoxy-1,4-benzoquinol methylase
LSAFLETALDSLAASVISVWPEHRPFIERSLTMRSPEEMGFSRQIAEKIVCIIKGDGGDMDRYAEDYRRVCMDTSDEQLNFMRTKKYNAESFEKVNSSIYQNSEYMTTYMNGLLLTQVLWQNHLRSLWFYVHEFLSARCERGQSLIEVGPGHGLLLHLAHEQSVFSKMVGWDISEKSLEMTSQCLRILGGAEKTNLRLQNVLALSDAPPSGVSFDRIVLSEVLEHLPDPVKVLRAISTVATPNALLYINVPANAPAVDHISLFRSAEEAHKAVADGGWEIVKAQSIPATGYTLERARRLGVAVNELIIAAPAGK